LIARLARGKTSVNFSSLDMLTRAAFSHHTIPFTQLTAHFGLPGGSAPEKSRYVKAIPQPYRDGHRHSLEWKLALLWQIFRVHGIPKSLFL
jgi:hypothetical protein